MAQTLSQLRDSIEELIKEQGEDSPVASFIVTKNSVCFCDENGLDVTIGQYEDRKHLGGLSDYVLSSLHGNDYVNEFINEQVTDRVFNVYDVYDYKMKIRTNA
jgi:hypothetical protein